MTALAMSGPTRRRPGRELDDLPAVFNAMQRASLVEVAAALQLAAPSGHPVCPRCDITVQLEANERWTCRPGCLCRGDVLDLIAMRFDVMGQRIRPMRTVLADAQNNDARFRHRAECLRPNSRAVVRRALAFSRAFLGTGRTDAR